MSFEGPTQHESPKVSEQEVIDALEKMGIEDEPTKELLLKYVDQCHTEAGEEAAAHPGDKLASERANIKAEMKIAQTYLKTERYEEYGMEQLESLIPITSEREELFDLAEEIDRLLTE